MTFVLKSRVRETTTITGTGDVTLNGAVAGYRAFNSAGVMVNGDTTWYVIVLPGASGGLWEEGIGTWVTGNKLQRNTVIDGSSGPGTLVSFTAGTKDVFMGLPASKGNVMNNTFPSGTLQLFQQTNAPLYWTKQVSHNDKALRVVSGTASSGGSGAFSSNFNNALSTANTTITNSTAPSHAHSYNTVTFPGGSGPPGSGGATTISSGGATTGSIGSDGAHNHAFQLNVAYVDLILASKD
jgi:hypothetical protein